MYNSSHWISDKNFIMFFNKKSLFIRCIFTIYSLYATFVFKIINGAIFLFVIFYSFSETIVSLYQKIYYNQNITNLNFDKLSNRCFLGVLTIFIFWNRYNYLSIQVFKSLYVQCHVSLSFLILLTRCFILFWVFWGVLCFVLFFFKYVLNI